MLSDMWRPILVMFYEAAHGRFWPSRLQWDLSKDPTHWEGVRLDSDGRLVGLEVVFDEELFCFQGIARLM